MDLDPLYRQAIFPQPFTILGRRLAVFSFAHLAALVEAESPYLDGERGDAAALMSAVGICSRDGSVPFTLGLVKRPLTPVSAAAGVSSWTEREKRKWAPRLANAVTLMDAEDAFGAYLAESFCGPKFGNAPGASAPSAPWIATIIASALRAGASPERVWGLPVAEWLWTTAAAGELESGKTAMMSQSEREEVEEINRWAETEEAAAAAKKAVERGKMDTWGKG